MRTILTTVFLSLLCVSPLSAQFKEGDPGGAKVGEARTSKWRAGVEVTAVGGPCKGITGYVCIPMEWPEQTVKIAEQDVSPEAKVSYQMVDEAKVMTIRIPLIASAETVKAQVTFEVTRNVQLAPENKDSFKLPEAKKLDPSIRRYLTASPKIEITDAGVKKLVKSLPHKEKAWEQVEALYDLARQKVEYKQGAGCKGAAAALKDGHGGHEDIVSLFIALCRASGVPARTVWVPEFCYAEFYLVDGQGEGHWLPCQPAGARAFGEMPDTRPILAKGDNFKAPYNTREKLRYMKEYLTGTPSNNTGQPRVKFVRQVVN